MKQKFGIAASEINVEFLLDGKILYQTKVSNGCVYLGEPQDSYNLIRAAFREMRSDISERKVSVNVTDFDTVRVGTSGTEFSLHHLNNAGVIPPKGGKSSGNTPKL